MSATTKKYPTIPGELDDTDRQKTEASTATKEANEATGDTDHPVPRRKLTPRDVILATNTISLSKIEQLIGVSRETVLSAYEKGKFNRQTGSGKYMELDGAEVLRWLEIDKVPHEVTEAAARLYWTAFDTDHSVDHGLTAADVIDASRWYHPDTIHELVGIEPRVTAAAVQRGQFHQGKSDGQLFGADILHWIESHAVPYKVTEAAAKVYLRMHVPNEPEPEPEKPTDVINLAGDKVDDWKKQEAVDGEDWRDKTWLGYTKLITRANTDQEQPGDASFLADYMAALNISRERALEDRRIIEEVAELHTLHADLKAANDNRIKAIEEFRATERRHKKELEAALKTRRAAEHHHQRASEAGHKLHMLSRQRADLFDVSNEPPTIVQG